jgi:hypothetical protein
MNTVGFRFEPFTPVTDAPSLQRVAPHFWIKSKKPIPTRAISLLASEVIEEQ